LWLTAGATLSVLATLPASTALAQADYPSRPPRIVVGFAPEAAFAPSDGSFWQGRAGTRGSGQQAV
jgi:hypothetical protein